MAFHPYLNFGGNCREAFTRYQEIFGGELFMMPMSDVPSDEQAPDFPADFVAHAALTIGDDLLMASDAPGDAFVPMQGLYVNYPATDVADAKRVFEALAEGGEVQMPLAETFFSPQFGMCVDRFGTPWMVNAEPAEQPGS